MEPLYKCVWMTAGVLTYRLCDRGYDCDRCLVDLALREGKAPPGEALAAATNGRVAAPVAIEGGRPFRVGTSGFYHPCHLWVRIGDAGAVRVGVDDLARRLLGPVTSVRLPRPGDSLRRDEPAWTIEGPSGSVVLPSPVSGTVMVCNEELHQKPARLTGSGPARSWLARLRPDRLREDLEHLFHGRRAAAWMRSETEKVRNRILAAEAVASGTLPDGGSFEPSVLDRLDVSLRRALIEEILVVPAMRQKKGR